MKDFLLPLAALPPFLATTAQDADGWWQIVQKNGVGFIFFVLFLFISWLSFKREKTAETERVNRETAAEAARVKRENEANAERLAMQTEIRDLNKSQLEQAEKHAKSLELLVKEQTKGMNDNATELRNVVRKYTTLPCVTAKNKDDA